MPRPKFIKEIYAGFELKFIKRLEVKFNPLHKNAHNIREFYTAATNKKIIRSNPNCLFKPTIVGDNSDPLVTVQYIDDHKLVINSKYLDAEQITKLIKHYEKQHQNAEDADDN